MTPAWASSATPHLLHLYECIFAIPQLLYLICYTSLSATSHLICYIALYWPLLLQPQLHPTLYWPHLLQPHLPHGFIPWGITPACLHLPQAACLHLPACTMSPHLTSPAPACLQYVTPPHLLLQAGTTTSLWLPTHSATSPPLACHACQAPHDHPRTREYLHLLRPPRETPRSPEGVQAGTDLAGGLRVQDSGRL